MIGAQEPVLRSVGRFVFIMRDEIRRAKRDLLILLDERFISLHIALLRAGDQALLFIQRHPPP